MYHCKLPVGSLSRKSAQTSRGRSLIQTFETVTGGGFPVNKLSSCLQPYCDLKNKTRLLLVSIVLYGYVNQVGACF